MHKKIVLSLLAGFFYSSLTSLPVALTLPPSSQCQTTYNSVFCSQSQQNFNQALNTCHSMPHTPVLKKCLAAGLARGYVIPPHLQPIYLPIVHSMEEKKSPPTPKEIRQLSLENLRRRCQSSLFSLASLAQNHRLAPLIQEAYLKVQEYLSELTKAHEIDGFTLLTAGKCIGAAQTIFQLAPKLMATSMAPAAPAAHPIAPPGAGSAQITTRRAPRPHLGSRPAKRDSSLESPSSPPLSPELERESNIAASKPFSPLSQRENSFEEKERLTYGHPASSLEDEKEVDTWQ